MAVYNGTANSDNISLSGNVEEAYGFDGNDVMNSYGLSNALFGGDGNDSLNAETPNHLADGSYTSLYGEAGDDSLRGSSYDQLYGGIGADSFTTLSGSIGTEMYGGDGNDTIISNGSIAILSGGAGDDTLQASSLGSDEGERLYGGDGNDILIAGSSSDILTGGVGSDIFKFTDLSYRSNSQFLDVITDFVSGVDKIDLTNVAATSLIFNHMVAGANNSVWYAQDDENTYMFVDITNDGVSDSIIQINGLINLTSSDFIGLQTNNTAPVATAVLLNGTEDEIGISGNVSANDADGDQLTYTLDGSAPNGLTFNSDGTFSYTPQAIDQMLKAGESRDVIFQYIANDGTLDSTSQQVTVTVNGVDDATTLSGDIAGTVGESGNPNANPTQFTGQISIHDVDNTDLAMLTDSQNGQYGQLTMTAQGQWSYQLNQASAIVQQLTASDIVQDTFTVHTSNGISQQLTLTITGSNIFTDNNNLDHYLGGSQNDTIYGYLGQDILNGQQGNDTLYGGADQDTLIGGEGDDYLDGGTHIDQLIGGIGDDTYVVNTVFDKITELGSEGIDTVFSSDSYQLSAHVENLTLTATGLTGNGNTLNNTMTAHTSGSTLNGGGGNDILNGKIGNDTLNGGTGSDRMAGGKGDDIYFVNGVGDQVIELANEGIDTVYTLVNYALNPNIENVILMAADITAFGNVYANSITASLYGNTLDGGGGDDTLIGRQGNDQLLGGSGKDLMIGAHGDDRYIVNTRGDRVVELANEGDDTIESSISWTMEDHVENLILTGSANNAAKGNTGANVITGNSGQNRLDGAGGVDHLVGGADSDTYVLARSYQQTAVVEQSDSGLGGVHDTIEFGVGVDSDQIWFAQAGNDLQVSVIGTAASVLVKDWYTTGMGIEAFTLRDGQALQANEVQQLVNQMAAFTPPAFGQTELNAEQYNALTGVIQSTWGIPI